MPVSLIMVVNIVILCALCAFVFGGYRDGFLLKLLSILSFFVCGFLAWWASSYVGGFIHLYPKHALPLQDTPLEAVLYDNLNRLLIFVILFVLLQLAVLIVKPFTKAANHVPVVSGINRLLGAALGALQAVLLMVLAAMICRLPFWKTGNEIASASLLRYSDTLLEALTFYAKEPLQEVSKLTSALEEKQTLSTAEKENIRSWLLEQNMKKEDVDTLLSALQ